MISKRGEGQYKFNANLHRLNLFYSLKGLNSLLKYFNPQILLPFSLIANSYAQLRSAYSEFHETSYYNSS